MNNMASGRCAIPSVLPVLAQASMSPIVFSPTPGPRGVTVGQLAIGTSWAASDMGGTQRAARAFSVSAANTSAFAAGYVTDVVAPPATAARFASAYAAASSGCARR